MRKIELKPKLAKEICSKFNVPLVNCPVCGEKISAVPGTRDALCQNCGYKEPCCD
jgi:DNA-directed RNA polymerase subunit RPC12/RpoP